MPSSHLCLHYHLIFGTKHRKPQIVPDLAPRLYDYIGGIVRGVGGVLIAAGGMTDHVHLLVRLGAVRGISDVLRDIKSGSSGWVHTTFPEHTEFAWQTGYAAFAVSLSGIVAVREYIERQEEHHTETTFQEELVAFLDKHGIPYDEQYLWE